MISELKQGNSVALVSDAGTPLISDPGETLVIRVRECNLDVVTIPGPCAAITALVSSGLPTKRFTFYGFMPQKTNEKKSVLKSISENKYSSIIYESPKRIKKLIYELKIVCGGDRKISIAKELTKKFELQIIQEIDKAIEAFDESEPKGEYTIIVEGKKFSTRTNIEDEEIKRELLELINAGLSHSGAANYLAKKYNKPKNNIYKLIIDN